MALDLYSLSVTPPAPLNVCPSSSPPTSNLTSPVETTTKQDGNSPVIYPWMRKVHINNPGETFLVQFTKKNQRK